MGSKYSLRLKSAGATGMVLALTSGLASAAVTDVSVNQVVENFGSPSAVSFEAINNNFASGFDSTNFDGIARNCGLSLYGYKWFTLVDCIRDRGEHG